MKGRTKLTIGRQLLSPLLGKVRYQRLFSVLYNASLAGLGFGDGANPDLSGEHKSVEYVKQKLTSIRQPLVIFDVGANIGQYATYLLGEFGTKANIRCFEPSLLTFDVLVNNLGTAPNVKLENFGFGEDEAQLTLYSLGKGSKLASIYNRRLEHQGITMTHHESVRIRTIDNYCQEEGIQRINLLKLDVEGHELKVLKGAEKMLDQDAIDFIQFEFGAANIDSRTYFRDFYELLHERYRLYRILSHGLWPIDRYRETYEVFKRATNYLAERTRA